MGRHVFFLLEMAHEGSDQDPKDHEIFEGTWTQLVLGEETSGLASCLSQI